MFKWAIGCVDSIVPTGSSFRLPELFKILKNHTNKMHSRLVAHQSDMLLMLIIPCIVNKKKGECCVYYLLLRINIWFISLTVNDGGRDQFLEQSVLSEKEMLEFNYPLCSSAFRSHSKSSENQLCIHEGSEQPQQPSVTLMKCGFHLRLKKQKKKK